MNTEKSYIMIVDDDVEDHLILSDGIAHVDPSQKIYFKLNGLEALQFLDELHAAAKTVMLFVIDLNMPKMGGAEFLQRIKADHRFRSIPAVIFSTSINANEKEHCIQLGAHAYFTKPLSFDESIATAKQLLQLIKLPGETSQ